MYTVEFHTYDNNDAQLTGSATYEPSTPDVPYLSNGDPGYPGDPELITIDQIHRDGVEFDPDELAESERERCDDQIRENVAGLLEDDREY